MRDLCFTSATNGWIVGQYGLMYHWDGINWTKQTNSFGYGNIADIYAPDTSNLFASTQLSMHWNTGSGWQSFPNVLSNPGYNRMDFIDANHGWAASGSQQVAYWNGLNWQNQSTSPGGYSLHDIDAVDSNHIWAVGGSGNVIIFCDGNNWSQQFSTIPTGSYLRSVSMIDTTNGWACGNNGIVVRFQNGNWNIVPGFNSGSTYGGVEFTDANHGWMTESYNSPGSGYTTIIHFFNGTNWAATDTFISVSPTGHIFHFRDSLHGTLSTSMIKKYMEYNHGEWYEREIYNATSAVTAVYFVDSLHGWAAGIGGMLMRTRTGGITTGISSTSSVRENSLYCYPNPNAGSVTIGFPLSKQGSVNLCIYNLQGAKVRTLVDETLHSGEYELLFESHGLSKGIYIGVLTTPDMHQTIKIAVE